MDLNFIISHDFRSKISNHPKWEFDLGNAYSEKSAQGIQVNIKDKFVVEFFNNYKGFCYKVGRLGPINFYTSSVLPDSEVWVFNGEEKFTYSYDGLMLRVDPEKYLGKLIMSATEEEE